MAPQGSRRLCGMLRTQTAARSTKNSRTFQDEAQSQPARVCAARWTKKSRTHRRGSLLPSVARQRPSTATGAGRLARQAIQLQPAIFRAQPARVSPIPSPVRLLCRLYAACSCCTLPRCRACSALDRGVTQTHTAARTPKLPRNQRVPTARSARTRRTPRRSRRSARQGSKKRRTYQPAAEEETVGEDHGGSDEPHRDDGGRPATTSHSVTATTSPGPGTATRPSAGGVDLQGIDLHPSVVPRHIGLQPLESVVLPGQSHPSVGHRNHPPMPHNAEGWLRAHRRQDEGAVVFHDAYGGSGGLQTLLAGRATCARGWRRTPGMARRETGAPACRTNMPMNPSSVRPR
jgi:hypothetical protein